MSFTTCMFCKRSLDEFCYSIYDSVNQPYLNIIQLFGDVDEHLRKDRCICYECLYVIRWIYFMKKILSEAIVEEDVAENDRVIAAFNIFKLKMSQPIFLQEDDTEDNSNSDDVEDEVSHSNIQWVQSDSENDLSAIDLSGYDDNRNESNNDHVTEVKTTKKTRRRNRTHFTHRKNTGRSYSRRSNQSRCSDGSDYVERPRSQPNLRSKNKEKSHRAQSAVSFGENNWLPVRRTRSVSRMEEQVEQEIENHESRNLGYFPCTINVCEQRCETFTEILRHHEDHHGLETSDIVLEDYAEQLQEYDTQGKSSHQHLQKKFKFRCLLNLCKKTYKAIETLTDHKIKQHNLMAKFWCTECFNLPFTTQVDLNHHTFEIHNNIDMNCIYCSLSFKNFRNYQAHMEDHWITMRLLKQNPKVAERLNYNEYPCKYCDRVFLEKNLLKQHNHSHAYEQRKKVERPSKTVFIKKYDSGEDCDRFKRSRTDTCSFRTRLQKLAVDKAKQVKLKNTGNIAHTENTQVVKVLKDAKPTISLPPRKRREYTQLEVVHQDQAPERVQEETSNEQCMNVPDITPDSQVAQVIVEESLALVEVSEELNQDSAIAAGNTDINESTEEVSVTPENSQVKDIEPCILSKMDEPMKTDSRNTSGKLIMTISLKSIEKYKSKSEKGKDDKSKNHERVKKRNKRSKIKKRSRRNSSEKQNEAETYQDDKMSATMLSIENQLSELFHEVPETKEELPPPKVVANSSEKLRKSKSKRKTKKPTPPEDSLEQILQETCSNDNPSDLLIVKNDVTVTLPETCPSTSTKSINGVMQPEIKEDTMQNSSTNKNFVLNRDEINKIIFGDQANNSLVKHMQSNVVHEIIPKPLPIEDVDNIEIVDLSTSPSVSPPLLLPMTQLPQLSEVLQAELPELASGKRKSETIPKDSPKTKSRKLKRKPDKIQKLILDADGNVKGKKRLHKSKSKANQIGSSSVPVNVKMKDHLYAKSAFSAFKQSKWEPTIQPQDP